MQVSIFTIHPSLKFVPKSKNNLAEISTDPPPSVSFYGFKQLFRLEVLV
ncbi:hypothetical protein LEP1GSC034_2409 [Leptospira interrogans str. 2003000735]|uniref:Uncharacterized protein n=2 Tax=Leptospira interrogans TaxID=173 RepID=M7A0X1_LEPIR|nr:hypothetical protein G436_0389 [Leptospira interrogans serovar Hardjo str. Norma]EJP15667.1 hypothetical protein LEP1GSC080_3848 [Leptospira interrogans str. FPW2026]EKN87321.1 hypothetical protein LEP1GSC027_3157 [Leptospira interrogans str. 2002000624]EKO06561.1 hypothetical protein LEP1GSC077_2581 [Leptospira interrogans str. C10069]EKO95081.1 hypothetical protein LEP1GSC057_0392 [Leptospira interrogans str. Brem 329]EKP87137.1 hypothetical protein LEP1GSC020_2760 [Leptospira interrogans